MSQFVELEEREYASISRRDYVDIVKSAETIFNIIKYFSRLEVDNGMLRIIDTYLDVKEQARRRIIMIDSNDKLIYKLYEDYIYVDKVGVGSIRSRTIIVFFSENIIDYIVVPPETINDVSLLLENKDMLRSLNLPRKYQDAVEETLSKITEILADNSITSVGRKSLERKLIDPLVFDTPLIVEIPVEPLGSIIMYQEPKYENLLGEPLLESEVHTLLQLAYYGIETYLPLIHNGVFSEEIRRSINTILGKVASRQTFNSIRSRTKSIEKYLLLLAGILSSK